MKNPTTKDLYDLIEKQIVKSSNLEAKFDSLNTKFDDHIVEFNSFKSDILSLPTISKELKIKNT